MPLYASDKWTYNGVRTLIMESPELRVEILLDLGATISTLTHKKSDVNLLYRHYKDFKPFKSIVDNYPREDSLHTFFGGGYFEALPNAGYTSINANHVKQGLHGELPFIPFECQVIQDKDKIEANLTGDFYRYPFRLEKKITISAATPAKLDFKEKLINLSPSELHYSWLHHPTFGSPFLDESVEIDVPAAEIKVHEFGDIIADSTLESGYNGRWPYAKRKDGEMEDLRKYPKVGSQNTVDVVYIPSVKKPTYSIYNRNLGLGVRFDWDKAMFPHLWYWRPIGGGRGDPWFGTIYAMSLEIASSYPATGLDDQVANQTSKTIKAESAVETFLSLEVYSK